MSSQLTAQYHTHLNIGDSHLYPMLQVVTQDKWPIDVGLYGHCHRQSYFMFTSAAHSFESTVGTLHSLNVTLLPTQTTPMTLLYAGEPMKKTNSKLSVLPQ